MITLESYDRDTGKRHYGMSTAAGDSVDKLNSNFKQACEGVPMPQGSSCMDYSTKKVYFYDGISWK